jgi:hypothetical protein
MNCEFTVRALEYSIRALAMGALLGFAMLPAHGATAPHFPGLPTQSQWQNKTPGWSATERTLTLIAGKKTDWFEWPGGDYHADSSPRLLFKTDGDFSFSTQVDVDARKTYDAGCLAIYGTADKWAKLCLEAQNDARLSVISVVTRGLSDDVTSFAVGGTSTYLKVAKNRNVLFFYTSKDGKAWEIVRKFNLESPAGLWVGFSAQSPDGEGAKARFTNFHYSAGPVNLWDLK